jgi:hypothetical protein
VVAPYSSSKKLLVLAEAPALNPAAEFVLNPAEAPADQAGRQFAEKRQAQQKAHEPRNVQRRPGS